MIADIIEVISIYDMQTDLNTDRSLKAKRKELWSSRGLLIFDPDNFKSKMMDLSLDKHELSMEILIQFAEIAQNVRKNLSKAAAKLANINQSID